jgi:hypothetical protein
MTAAVPRPPPPAIPPGIGPADEGGPPPPVRLCRDCRYLRPDWRFAAMTLGVGWKKGIEHARFGHPAATQEHTEERAAHWLVSGRPSREPTTSQQYCSVSRKFDHLCGPEARYWEAPRPDDPP